MAPVRHAFRKDKSQTDIVTVLRKLGCTVVSVHIPHGPDLLVGHKGKTYLVEVKSPRDPKTYKVGKLSEGQETFIKDWNGSPVAVVYTPEEAITAVFGPGWMIDEQGSEP